MSSGNISLEFMNLNFVEMIQQTSGEFEEKFKARNLTEVLNISVEEACIRADGRRTWRILENIYNNAAKYAMEGTRIYADLKVENGQVIFSLKNISQQQLNISADELTERFIRGDISRSTEQRPGAFHRQDPDRTAGRTIPAVSGWRSLQSNGNLSIGDGYF